MAAKTQSQFLKNQGSAMRRTATSVRGIAAGIKDPASIQALLKAAQIIEAEAGQVMTKHKQAAADERAFEVARQKALPKAFALAKSLPMSTTAEKLAITGEGDFPGYVLRVIGGTYPTKRPTPAVLEKALAESLEAIAKSIAYSAARSGKEPEVTDLFLARLQREAKRPEIVRAAEIFDRINAEVAPC